MVDYSKWKNIEISDDEDEVHPNIHTPSLFKWRHEARVERMAELDEKKEKLKLRAQSNQEQIDAVNEMLKLKDDKGAELQKELVKLVKEGKQIKDEVAEISTKERKMPWNVDTISKPGFAKTLLNKKEIKPIKELSEEEQEIQLKQFIKENEELCKEFGMYHKYEESKHFLQKHPHLVTEDTANYLVFWAIELVMEEKVKLMEHVAHQIITLHYILELGKALEVDPRSCISSFFDKIQCCDADFIMKFEEQIEAIKERIRVRAEEKIKAAVAEAEQEAIKARLGPGGLDPAEVFEELPDELKTCFETRDIQLLKDTIAAMPDDVVKYHMKRCVDSGLWVPQANTEESDKEIANSTTLPTQSDTETEGCEEMVAKEKD